MQGDDKKKPTGKKVSFNIFWMYGIIAVVLLGIYYTNESTVEKNAGWSELVSYVKKGGVKSIVVKDNVAEVELTDSLAEVVFGKELVSRKDAKPRLIVEGPSRDKIGGAIEQWTNEGYFNGRVDYKNDTNGFMSFLFSFGPIILLVALWYFIMKRMSSGPGSGGVFNVGKSKAKLFDKDNNTNVTFKDVAGLQEAKTEVAEIVAFLKNPQIYTELGGKIPKGALLVGPPGTGKTLLAKAVAGEANVPFFSLSGSDFVEMFVGVGASRVRDLFRQAKEKAPCIVFIDEIDAVGRARGKNPNMGANDERESTLNQLLTEMDGFGTNSGVIILAATNRADILDKALLRAGRFDRQIYVELPDLNGRRDIFNVHLSKIKKDDSVDVDLLARQTPGFSGADIANVCNEAALIAARHKKKVVQRQDFMDAVDRIVGGLEKKTKITTADERKSIAVHEGGHAVVSWHLQYADPLVKVTIVPRGNALGAAHYLPEERQIMPTQALLDKLCSLLGGRAAEEMFLGCISTGAMNDLERATNMAYAMVVYYGMSERLPNISYYDSTGQNYGFSKPYSEERARIIDEEVSRFINEQYVRAKELLKKYADGHKQLTDVLLSREVIFTEDVERIFGKRQWQSRTDEIMEMNGQNVDEPKSDDAEAAEPTTDESAETPVAPPPFVPKDDK